MGSHVYFVFFFKQKTAYEMRISDWSSDVCSSDLAEHHALGAAGVEQVLQGARVGDPGVEKEAFEVLARVARVVGGDQVRAHVEAVLDAADGVGEAAAAVGEADLELRQPLQHAAEHQAAGGARLFGRRSEAHTSELQSLMRIS